MDNIVWRVFDLEEVKVPEPIRHNVADLTSANSLSTFVQRVDENNYYWLSKTDTTEYLYKVSSMTVSGLKRPYDMAMDGLNTVLTFLPF